MLLTVGLCFGLGFGLAPTVRSAHACSCGDSASWELDLETITGDGDPSVEQTFWTAEASLGDGGEPSLYLRASSSDGHSLELERVQ
jgi:hypothetical protein